MVHLAKDPQTGVMSRPRCKAVRQLAELAIHDAKNDRTVPHAAVSSSWRLIFSMFMPLVVEYQANNNKPPAYRKRQQPEEGEVVDYDDTVVQKLTNDKAQLQGTVTQLQQQIQQQQQQTATQLQQTGAQQQQQIQQLRQCLREANNRL
jgi:hypothetical protein